MLLMKVVTQVWGRSQDVKVEILGGKENLNREECWVREEIYREYRGKYRVLLNINNTLTLSILLFYKSYLR